ncbi:MAG: glycosyltransferase [Cyanobacteria bacterium K_DeepCast_35m_m2_023]|nr:glycosyltransferase [Cyanobacteria bacterium K_DeepCast_35m_m2_023]
MNAEPKTKVLFVHQNYPGQFRHLAPALMHSGWDVLALRQGANSGQPPLPHKIHGVRVVSWQARRGTTLAAHPWAHDSETKLIRAEAAAIRCEQLKQQGWSPDLIVGHPGWGELLFLRHLWPDVPQLHFLEFHYAASGLDVGFDPEFPQTSWQDAARVTAKAGPSLLNLSNMDRGLSPTEFQASTYPAWVRERIHVIHDGIDTRRVAPNREARFKLGPQGPELRPGDPVLTFVNRNLEPYRGYHRLMRALPAIQRACPKAITVIVGADGVSYGAAAPTGTSWKQVFLDEVAAELDLSRVVFTGHLAYDSYLKLLQVSACHIYLTYPFVLGWSCLEALAAGAVVVGSATAPVQEVISDGDNGLLVDFFDQQAMVDQVCDVLNHPQRYAPLRQAARARVIERYDLHSVCLPAQLALVRSLRSD